jgi:hypothetical protein
MAESLFPDSSAASSPFSNLSTDASSPEGTSGSGGENKPSPPYNQQLSPLSQTLAAFQGQSMVYVSYWVCGGLLLTHTQGHQTVHQWFNPDLHTYNRSRSCNHEPIRRQAQYHNHTTSIQCDCIVISPCLATGLALTSVFAGHARA